MIHISVEEYTSGKDGQVYSLIMMSSIQLKIQPSMIRYKVERAHVI